MGISVGKLLKVLAVVLVAFFLLVSLINVISTVAPLGEQLSKMLRYYGSGGFSSEAEGIQSAITAAWMSMLVNAVPTISLCAIQFGLGAYLESKGI